MQIIEKIYERNQKIHNLPKNSKIFSKLWMDGSYKISLCNIFSFNLIQRIFIF
jgi:hypothetical protein